MIAIMLAVIACGAIVIFLAPRRRFPYPSCGKCRYNLTGLNSMSRCPECGAEFDRSPIVEAGTNDDRGFWIYCGVMLMVVSPLIAGAAGLVAVLFLGSW